MADTLTSRKKFVVFLLILKNQVFKQKQRIKSQLVLGFPDKPIMTVFSEDNFRGLSFRVRDAIVN